MTKDGRKIVGLVPFAEDFGKEDLYQEFYKFNNTYGKRAEEVGLTPIGVVPVDHHVPAGVLELCDCYIIMGGHNIRRHHMEVIDDAVKHGKKLLGICLGCQSIHKYFAVAAEAERIGYEGSIPDLYESMRKDPLIKLIKVTGHHHSEGPTVPRDALESIKHRVLFTEGSHIRRLLGPEVMGATLHNYAIGEAAPALTVTGRAEDGTIEALEYGENIIGVQFHPDVDTKTMELFEFLL